MPITKSAKKALRGSQKKKIVNDRKKKTMKEAIKKITKTAKTDPKEAQNMISATYKAIDKAAKTGIIKKNTAARRKSKVSRIVKEAKTK